MSYKICDEIITRCSRCNFDLNHMIIAAENGEPTRVQCLTCKSEHNYRSPKRLQKRILRAATPQEKTRVRQSHEEIQWRERLEAKTQTPVPYNAAGTFKKDTLIYHSTFGTGLIVDKIYPDKMVVYFEEGLKTLKGIVE